MSERTEHIARTAAIVVLFLAALAVLAWIEIGHVEAPELRAHVQGALVILAPAVWDSLRVRRKQVREGAK